MKVTDLTRDTLRLRRSKRGLLSRGYEEVGENGGRLWELHRGSRQHMRIVDAVVALDGKSVFVKVVDDA